jgi:hypothetical protein
VHAGEELRADDVIKNREQGLGNREIGGVRFIGIPGCQNFSGQSCAAKMAIHPLRVFHSKENCYGRILRGFFRAAKVFCAHRKLGQKVRSEKILRVETDAVFRGSVQHLRVIFPGGDEKAGTEAGLKLSLKSN